MILAITFLVLAICAYSISQLHQMGKLPWQTFRNTYGFFGEKSWINKYKWKRDPEDGLPVLLGKPAFFGATTFLVSLTDLYHAAQAISFLSLSLSFGFLMSNHYYSLGAYIIVHIVHYFTYKFLSK